MASPLSCQSDGSSRDRQLWYNTLEFFTSTTGVIMRNWWKMLNNSSIVDQCHDSVIAQCIRRVSPLETEFFRLLRAFCQTDRWTGRLTGNVDVIVAHSFAGTSLTVITATRPHSHTERLVLLPVLVSMTENSRPRTGTARRGRRTQNSVRHKDVFLPFIQCTFCYFRFFSSAIDAHAYLSQSESIFKCFPVWEISVKWSCLSACLFLAFAMESPEGFVRRSRLEVAKRRRREPD